MKIFQIFFLYYLLESGIDFHVWCEVGIKLPIFSPQMVIQLAQHHLWQRSFMPPPQQCCHISHAHIRWVYFWALYSSSFYLSILPFKFFLSSLGDG